MMVGELLHENRGKIIGACIGILTLVVLLLGAELTQQYQTKKNDQYIAYELSTLSYTEEAAKSELKRLEPLSECKPVSRKMHGELYRALAEISYMTGDEMLYNQYVAYALYYLGETDDSISRAYLINKYIGRLYANGCYTAAEEMLLELAADTDISKLPLALQAAYYLSRADIAQMQGKDSSRLLELGRAAISLTADDGERRLNQAKADILAARSLIGDGDIEEAKALMSGYTETDEFGLGRDQVYVVCDFKIPFYEIEAKIALYEQDTAALEYNVKCYLQCCEDYNFRAMKLRLLQYLDDNAPAANERWSERYRVLAKQVSQENLEEMTDKYGQFLLTDIDAKETAISILAGKETIFRRPTFLSALALCAAAVLFCLVNVFLSYVNKDGLTRLSNRKQYEKMRIHCERRRIPYCLLMLDIDDFKKVNDHFGHERGDEVLRAISAILRRYSGRGIFAYRYGGEELCVMLLRVPEKRSREIAEELRSAIEETVSAEDMRITVSIGVSSSKEGENIFHEADIRLYQAKEGGKNRVC